MTRLRIGVYDHHWATLGGGEMVDASLAEVLSLDHDVTILGPAPVDIARVRERLGPDLTRCDFRLARSTPDVTEASASFDLFINGAFLSKAENRAARGYYYVMFPQAPFTWTGRVRSALARAGVQALGASGGQPGRARALRERLAVRVDDARFARSYHRFLSDSRFTAHWVTRLWKVSSDVLYPPVRAAVSPGDKGPLIVSIGRFFNPAGGHCKKQGELVDAFARLVRSGRADGWELLLIGGCDAANREYLLDLKRRARGLPIRFAVNAPGEVVTAALARASFYWHAGGYGEDLKRHPERFEHFGIAVIEALAAGAVPLVYGAAGPAEIVRDGIDGRHWHTPDELAALTADLAAHPVERERLVASALVRAREFSSEVFAADVRRIIAADFGDASQTG